MYIIELLVLCKGGNFNIHIWAGLAISSAKQGKSGYIYNSFHENPNHIHTELTFISP